MRIPLPLACAVPLLLAGCATAPQGRPAATAPIAAAGLGAVMGQPARAVTAALGAPALDLREGPARKLQYRGPACVLDAYLYQPTGGGEPVVTWIDARAADGRDMDRASCIAALSRR